MLGNGSPCLSYLSDLLRAMKTFFHPSNSGKFQKRLVEFIRYLGQSFADRLHLSVSLLSLSLSLGTVLSSPGKEKRLQCGTSLLLLPVD